MCVVVLTHVLLDAVRVVVVLGSAAATTVVVVGGGVGYWANISFDQSTLVTVAMEREREPCSGISSTTRLSLSRRPSASAYTHTHGRIGEGLSSYCVYTARRTYVGV